MMAREDACKQMTFEQFLRISKFELEVPQLLDDLFTHMTTIGLKDIVRKQQTQTILQPVKGTIASKQIMSIPSKRYTQQTSVDSFTVIDQHELNLMKRQITFDALIKHYDQCDLHFIIKGFIQLSQNGNDKVDVMNIFISQQSILNNFQKVFKTFNESLALRLYNVLSKGVNFNRVYLHTYLIRVWPLF